MGLIGPVQLPIQAAAMANNQAQAAGEEPGNPFLALLNGEGEAESLPPGLLVAADAIADGPAEGPKKDGAGNEVTAFLFGLGLVGATAPDPVATGEEGGDIAGDAATAAIDEAIQVLEEAANEADIAGGADVTEVDAFVAMDEAPGEPPDTIVDIASDTVAATEGDPAAAVEPSSGDGVPSTDIDLPARPPDDTGPATEAPPDAIEVETEGMVRTVGSANSSEETPLDGGDDSQATIPGLEPVDTIDSGADSPETQVRLADMGQVAQARGTSSAAAQEAPEPIRMEGQPLDQVADAIIERVTGDGGEARLVLDPPDLGEIVIKLFSKGDQVRIEVVAERPDALQVLRDGSPSLEALLAERGLDLRDAEFMLGDPRGQANQFGSGSESEEQSTGFAGLLGLDEPADPEAQRNLQRLRAAYNPDGDLLYRV